MSPKRIIIKFSGEVMETGNREANLDFAKIKKLAQTLKKLVKAGYQVGVVLGAGNIFRARMVKNMAISRVVADHMGMLATAINSLALQSVLEKLGQEARGLSPFSLPDIMEDYIFKRAINHLSKKRIVIFAGGTGNPYFTTDTALVLRALEVGAGCIYKATNVSGVYSSDPDQDRRARLYKHLTYQEALQKNLRVMDMPALALAAENDLALTVFKYSPANVYRAVVKNSLGTKVSN